MSDFFRVVEAFGLLVGLLAVVLAWKHERDMRRTAKEAESHTERLDEIRKTLSTRYLAPFPDFLSGIVALLETAQSSIDILCDFPGYCSFSRPGLSLKYRHIIEARLQRGVVRVNLMILNRGKRMQSSREQYPKNKDEWEAFASKQANAENIQRLLKIHEWTGTALDLGPAKFIELLEVEDQRILREVMPEAHVVEIDTHLPLFFWLVDEREAIFSIPTLSEDIVEYGFTTTDPKLISAFLEMKRRYNPGFPDAKKLAEVIVTRSET